jgi:large subunit ribosomal protein L17
MNAIRILQASLYTERACKAAIDLAQSTQKTSGFTRVTPLKYRDGDASMLVTLEFVA